MSFSNAPDAETLGRVAGALAVDEAFVEKDWFVVEAIQILLGLDRDDFVPVFSGGTSLLKAHGLIKRFSEDIDFKLKLSEGFLAGRYQPIRSNWAIPRASFRSVFTVIAESAAFTCRDSSKTTSRPAATSPACNHCDSGPASSPIRHTGNSSSSNYRTSVSGSLATLTSRTILPFASTMHTLLSFRETSIPA
jgi:hypothetical protein